MNKIILLLILAIIINSCKKKDVDENCSIPIDAHSFSLDVFNGTKGIKYVEGQNCPSDSLRMIVYCDSFSQLESPDACLPDYYFVDEYSDLVITLMTDSYNAYRKNDTINNIFSLFYSDCITLGICNSLYYITIDSLFNRVSVPCNRMVLLLNEKPLTINQTQFKVDVFLKDNSHFTMYSDTITLTP